MQDVTLISKIRSLKDPELLQATHARVTEEKQSTLLVLYHLQEVARRKLYLARGFQSLFQFATESLGYSPAAAQRRIQAMRLLSEIPELEAKIQEGKITLDTAAQAQSFFKQEEKAEKLLSPQEKREVLEQLVGKSSRECERALASLSSHPEQFLRPDSVKPVSETHSEIRFVASEKLLKDLERVKELLSHKNPTLNMSELIEEMAKITIQKLDPAIKAERKKAKEPVFTPAPEVETRYVAAATKRTVMKRDDYCCTYRAPETGRRCGSRFQIELDHCLPFSLGGDSSAENLRVRCRAHNQWSSEKVYGRTKATEYDLSC